MTLNYRRIVERYPKPNVTPVIQVLAMKSSLYLTKKLTAGYALPMFHIYIIIVQFFSLSDLSIAI